MFPIPEHEAGHVVMAFALGIEVVTVDSFPGRTECGKSFTEAIRRPNVAAHDALRAALFCLGGVLQENLLAGLYDHGPPIPPARPHRPAASDGDLPDDLWEAYRFADMINCTQAPAVITHLVSRGIDILRRNMEPAQAIAQALREAGTLSGEAARAIWLAHGGCEESDALS